MYVIQLFRLFFRIKIKILKLLLKKKDLELLMATKTRGTGQNDTATKWHGRQIDTEGLLGTEGHFGTTTKCLSFNFFDYILGF